MKIVVVVNPNSGQHLAWRPVMEEVFGGAGIQWDVRLTEKAGDAHHFAQAAVQQGYEAVAVFGGDGTVMEVASGLAGSEVPMAVLPGGTANVMSKELGIPPMLRDACNVLCGQYAVRTVDMGRVGDRIFALRIAIGLEATMVEGADPALKERLGMIAYGVSAFRGLVNPSLATYRIEMDQETVETQALSIMIANSGHLGLGDLRVSRQMSIADGKLDVVVFQATNLPEMAGIALSVLGGTPDTDERVYLWQVKKVRISASPAQDVQVDGEIIGKTPVTAEVLPHALKVIVPVAAVPEGEQTQSVGEALQQAATLPNRQ